MPNVNDIPLQNAHTEKTTIFLKSDFLSKKYPKAGNIALWKKKFLWAPIPSNFISRSGNLANNKNPNNAVTNANISFTIFIITSY